MGKTLIFTPKPAPVPDIPIVISEGAWLRLKEHKTGDSQWPCRSINGMPGFVVIMVDREVLDRMNKLDLNPTVAVITMTGGGGR